MKVLILDCSNNKGASFIRLFGTGKTVKHHDKWRHQRHERDVPVRSLRNACFSLENNFRWTILARGGTCYRSKKICRGTFAHRVKLNVPEWIHQWQRACRWTRYKLSNICQANEAFQMLATEEFELWIFTAVNEICYRFKNSCKYSGPAILFWLCTFWNNLLIVT